MRSCTVIAGLGLLAAAVAPVATAAAAEPGPGPGCGFYAFTSPLDPTRTRYVGEMDGGPVVIAEPGNPSRTGRLTCAIRAGGDTHLAEARETQTSLTTAVAVSLPPTVIEYTAGADELIVLCTSVEIDGEGTYYQDGETSDWSTDPTVPCAGLTETT